VVGVAKQQLLGGDHARAEDVHGDLVLCLPVVHGRGHLVVDVTFDQILLVAPDPDENLELLDLRNATLQANVGQRIFRDALDDLFAGR